MNTPLSLHTAVSVLPNAHSKCSIQERVTIMSIQRIPRHVQDLCLIFCDNNDSDDQFYHTFLISTLYLLPLHIIHT